MNLIEDKVLQSRAVNHPYLCALSSGMLPDMPSALRDFVTQYRGYSLYFTDYIRALMKLLPEEERNELKHNLEEEMGQVDDAELHVLGIESCWVAGVKHSELFLRFADAIGADLKNTDFCPEVLDWKKEMLKICSTSAAMGVGALGFGTEMIVKPIYMHLIEAIGLSFPWLSKKDSIFFDLHTHFDDEHAETLKRIGTKMIQDSDKEQDLLKGIDAALNHRAKFWDIMYKRALAMPSVAPKDADRLYNRQAHNWARKSPICLSDFTARPKVLDLCESVQGKIILDLGCGDGYCSRILAERGATVIGLDISEKMIEAGKEEESKKSLGIKYYVANATDCISILKSATEPLQYDVIVAVFLFNYVKREEMEKIMSLVNGLLKSGGKFIFSVPHPCFPFWKRQQSGYPFKFDLENYDGYFDSKDELFSGKIWRKDGKELDVQLVHKTVDDYITSLNKTFGSYGIGMKELYADGLLQEEMPDFVGNIKGLPLHIAFNVTKDRLENKILDVNQFTWKCNPTIQKLTLFLNSSNIQVLQSLPEIEIEMLELFDKDGKRIDIDGNGLLHFKGTIHNLDGSLFLNLEQVQQLAHLGSQVFHQLQLESFGVVIIQGLSSHLTDKQLKLAYFLLSIFSSRGVYTKRGRLYDVYDRKLDIESEDVLFSATNAASTYHTDSTDRFYFPDIVGLMCLHQVDRSDQGHLYLVNSANVYEMLRKKAPAFVLQELQRPIIRDLIDQGFGGVGPKAMERLINNQYPVFTSDVNQPFSFRYMRFWIDKGYEKVQKFMSTETKDALDFLDEYLKKADPLTIRLERGDMIWCNNHLIAHNRDMYQDPIGSQPRLMSRVWLK